MMDTQLASANSYLEPINSVLLPESNDVLSQLLDSKPPLYLQTGTHTRQEEDIAKRLNRYVDSTAHQTTSQTQMETPYDNQRQSPARQERRDWLEGRIDVENKVHTLEYKIYFAMGEDGYRPRPEELLGQRGVYELKPDGTLVFSPTNGEINANDNGASASDKTGTVKEEWLTIRETTKLYGCTRQYIYQLRDEGYVKWRKSDGRLLFRKEDICELLEKKEGYGIAEPQKLPQEPENYAERFIGTSLGRYIRQFRKEKGWTLQEVVDKMDSAISPAHLSYLERGKTNPTVNVLIELAKALRVEPASLLSQIKQNK